MTRIIHDIQEMKNIKAECVGFVPTMGFLHSGHLNLVKMAKKLSKTTVVSIFVNPIQFGEGEDYEKYPREISRDIAILEEHDVDYLFMPGVKDMYPPSFDSTVELTALAGVLCGKDRPGHFSAVATVILKLLNIIKPAFLILGQKDFQQTVIIKKMLSDFNIDTKVIVCPTVREESGLAMSSRNLYLLDNELTIAAGLYHALKAGEKTILKRNLETRLVISEIKKRLSAFSGIDYIAICETETLTQPERLKANTTYAILAAVKIGDVRLIDNILTRTT